MTTNAHDAYKTHQRTDETVRETEAHALLSCASRLEEARKEEASREVFAAALRHNQKLWTIFQVCVCEPDNELPQDLKILLLNLSRYVDKVTFRALAEENKTILRSLISINRTIASGLRKNAGQVKHQASAAAAAPQPAAPEQVKPVSTSA